MKKDSGGVRAVLSRRSSFEDGEANAVHFSMNRIRGILLATAGMAMQWAALHCITFAGTVFCDEGVSNGEAWIVNSIFTFIVFLGLFFAADKLGSLLPRKRLLWSAALLACAGSVVITVGYAVDDAVFAVFIGNALIACGTTPFIVAWGELYRKINPKSEQLFVTLVGSIMSVALYMIASNLPWLLSIIVFLFMLVGAVACLLWAYELFELSRGSWKARAETCIRKSPVLLLVCVAVYSIPYNYLRGDSNIRAIFSNTDQWSCVLAVVVVVMILVALTEAAAEARGFLLVPSFVLLFISAAMIVHLFAGGEDSLLVSALLYSGYYLFLAMVYLALGPIAATTGTNAIKLFSGVMLANVGGLLIGAFLSGLNDALGPEAATVVVLGVTYAILFAGFALLHGRSYSLFRINSFHEEEYSFEFLDDSQRHVQTGASSLLAIHGQSLGTVESPAGLMPSSLTDLCAAVGDAHGLSSREQEVLCELVRGRTIASIADNLVLSENTIKAHTKAIYRKLKVHTREELFECVERFRMQQLSDGHSLKSKQTVD